MVERVDEKVKKLYGRVSKESKITFLAAVVFGFIAHMYMFTNKLPNYDDGLNSFGATFGLGRWFLWIVGATAYHLNLCFSLPWVNGLLTIGMLGVAAAMVVELLKVKSLMGNICIGAAFVVFPSWTGTLFFMFTAPYYAFAVLLGVCSVWIVQRYHKIFFAAPVLLACSIGIYQSYIPFFATLYVVLLLLAMYDEEMDWIRILKQAFYYLFQLFLGVILYFVCMKISLFITKQELRDYKGADTMGSFTLDRIPKVFEAVVENFMGLFLNNNLELSYNLITKGMYFVLLVVCIFLMGHKIVAFYRKKRVLEAIAFLILSIAFVIAINGIYIMVEEGVYSLMCFSYVFMIIFPLALLDRNFQKDEKWKRKNVLIVTEYITVCFIFAGILCYSHFANGQYLSIQLSYEQATNYAGTLITKIKSTEGYSDELKVCFIGHEIQDRTLYRNDIMGVFDMSGRDRALIDAYSRIYFLKYYCGFEAEIISVENIEVPVEDIEQMPCYPDEHSIQVVGDTVIVKLGE